MKQETILEKRRRQSDRIRQMTVAAMLSAITALLVFTPIGMIQLPPPLLAVTTVHVPVLIAALVIWCHRENITRLLHHQERKFQWHTGTPKEKA